MSAAARVRGPLLLTGFGLGAFLDGIVLHQVLQWHHLVVEYRAADTLDGLQVNTTWDGVFHLASWVVVVAGVWWLARSGARLAEVRGRVLLGWPLVGWGLFHVVDQVVFHMVLDAHHIRMVDNYLVYDVAYTAIGLALVAGGLVLARGGGRDRHPATQ